MTPLPDKLRYLHDTINTTDTRCTNPKCTNERCVGCLAFAPKDTPDTEWSSVDRYSVETGLLKRFFKLYEEGRKTGDPQNFIDYFKAEHYLLTEVGKAITSRDTYWKNHEQDMYESLEKANREQTILDVARVRDERDTYWKERVRKIVDIVKYDSCVYQGPYAEHRARGGDELRKILLQSITNEDNLK